MGGFLRLAAAVAVLALLNFTYHLCRVRLMVRRVQSQHGVEILPHSFLFGHLLVIAKLIAKGGLPPKCHSHWLSLLFIEQYPELTSKGLLYLDVWPISEPLLSIWHPDLIVQMVNGNFRKAKLMRLEFEPVTGGKDLLTSEGSEWKRARSMFNPGFSARNLMSLLPEFIEEIEPFRLKLKQASESKETIKLENLTTMLAIDIIGLAVLGVRLKSQIKPVPLVQTMLSQVPLLYNSLDLVKLLNPVRYFRLWLYRRRFRDQLVPYVEEAAKSFEQSAGPKTVLRLALKERVNEDKAFAARGVPGDFLEQQVPHFWAFMFAGHDTTAITIAYIYYLLSRNPQKASKLHKEHDEVLGPNAETAAQRLLAEPALINKLPYTSAVMKESLRLWTPVSGGVRSSTPGHVVIHPDTGEKFPTHGWMVNHAGAILHRLPEFWPEPNTFLPERWLVEDPDDPLHPKKDCFRPFETGLRNCIGQELVSIEIRLVLALTCREFEVEAVFPDDGYTFLGEQAYNVEVPESVATAHARDRMPVRVKARAQAA